MRRVLYWLRRRSHKEKRECGAFCLNCRYFKNCISDGAERTRRRAENRSKAKPKTKQKRNKAN